jgi:mono/diheme cytochrome c family protein
MPLGSMTPPNLTPGGSLAEWTDGEIVRVIREGTNRDGHLSPLMAIMNFRSLSDEDANSIVAYLRSHRAVENGTEIGNLTPLTLAFVTLSMFPIKPLPELGPVASVPVGRTVEYGRYVSDFIGCTDCHGEDLSGGAGGLAPKGPSLRVVKDWSTEQFIQTIRTGVNPTGRNLNSDDMPWNFIARFDDDELAGLYTYLVSFP